MQNKLKFRPAQREGGFVYIEHLGKMNAEWNEIKSKSTEKDRVKWRERKNRAGERRPRSVAYYHFFIV